MLLPCCLLAGELLAQVPNTAKDILGGPGIKAKKDKEKPAAGKKDLVEDALALPKGVVLEKLRKDQQDAYNKLKDEYKPKLQEALGQVAKATKEQDKRKAAGEVGKLRGEIKQKIAAILKQPDPNAVKQMQNAAKQMQNAANRARSQSQKGHKRY